MGDGLGFDPDFGSAAGLPQSPAEPAFQPSFPGGLSLSRGDEPGLPRGEEPGAPRSAFSRVAEGLFGDGSKDSSGGFVGGLGRVAKSTLPFAQLGLAGLGVKGSLDAAGASRRQARTLEQAQQMQREATQPLTQFGTKELQRAEAGQVDPAVQAQIDQWAQNAKLQAKQWFEHNKIGDSTMMESVLRDIDQKAVAMKAGNLQLMEQMGVGALGQAAGAATQGAQTAQTEQSQLDNLIRSANSALASMLA